VGPVGALGVLHDARRPPTSYAGYRSLIERVHPPALLRGALDAADLRVLAVERLSPSVMIAVGV
jgi:hypothetical protein